MIKYTTKRQIAEPDVREGDHTPRYLSAGPKAYCISSVYAHHAGASGYHHLAGYLGTQIAPSAGLKLSGETVLRVPAKLVEWYGGLHEYSRHNCVEELGVAMHLLAEQNSIYHFLYGEKGYRFSGALSGVRGNRVVASFHHAPSRFDEMVRYKRHLRYLDHAVAMASNQVEHLERWVGKNRVTVIPHGVDTDYWRPAESREDKEELHCVFAGLHMRDYATLEGIVDRVHQMRIKAKFTLLSRDERCGQIATKKNVHWIPKSSDAQFKREMQAADVLVLPLNDSTAVNSVLEAMGCGLAILTTTGGISDYLSPNCGLQFEKNDVEGFAQAIEYLANDRAALLSFKSGARERAVELSWSNVARQVGELYRALVVN